MTTESTTLSPDQAPPRQGLGALVLDALRGARHDYTNLPLRRAILLLAIPMVVTQSFNGAGDTRTPTYINLFCFWLLEIPVAWLLAKPLGFGPTGVFIAVLVGFSTMAVVAAALFRRGKWKRVAV